MRRCPRLRPRAPRSPPLADSRDRGEADRARALLLTLTGWTSPLAIMAQAGWAEHRAEHHCQRTRLRTQMGGAVQRNCNRAPRRAKASPTRPSAVFFFGSCRAPSTCNASNFGMAAKTGEAESMASATQIAFAKPLNVRPRSCPSLRSAARSWSPAARPDFYRMSASLVPVRVGCGEGTSADLHDKSLTPFMQAGRFVTPFTPSSQELGPPPNPAPASAETGRPM